MTQTPEGSPLPEAPVVSGAPELPDAPSATEPPSAPEGTLGLLLNSLVIAAAVIALLAIGYGFGEVMDRVLRPAGDDGSVVTWGSG